MTDSATHTEPGAALRAVCERQLERLRSDTPGVLAAVVATGDGFAVSSVSAGDVSPAKLAAMTSSMHALGAEVVREAALRSCHNVIIEAEFGKVVMLAVPDAGHRLLLNVIASHQAILGHLLWACKNCAEGIASHAVKRAS